MIKGPLICFFFFLVICSLELHEFSETYFGEETLKVHSRNTHLTLFVCPVSRQSPCERGISPLLLLPLQLSVHHLGVPLSCSRFLPVQGDFGGDHFGFHVLYRSDISSASSASGPFLSSVNGGWSWMFFQICTPKSFIHRFFIRSVFPKDTPLGQENIALFCLFVLFF